MRRPGDLVRERQQQVDDLRMRIEKAALAAQQARMQRLADMRRALRLVSPRNQVRQAERRLASLRSQLRGAAISALERKRAALRPLAAQLDALSPLAVLGRGYSLVWKETARGRTLVRNASELAPGDRVALQLARGRAGACIDYSEEPESDG
jgi:exodeoxyribonuclease VII large subunit